MFDGKEMLSQVFGGADDDCDPSALDDPAAPTLSAKGLAERNMKRAKALPTPLGVCGGVTLVRARSACRHARPLRVIPLAASAVSA